MSAKKKTHVTLGIGLVLLIGLAALLLVLLQQRSAPGDGEPAEARRVAPSPVPASRHGARRSPPARAPTRAAPAGPAAPSAAQVPRGVDAGQPLRRVEPPPRGGPSPREPLGVHTAPAAIPASIASETDPDRRARLMRMHRLAVARSRASRLRRRLRMLKTTLARGRRSKNWGADEMQRTERDIADLQRAVTAAEERVERARRAVDEER